VVSFDNDCILIIFSQFFRQSCW